MNVRFLLIGLLSVFISVSNGQSDVLRLTNALMKDSPIEEDLQYLCDNIGGRVTGSEANEKAVDWTYAKFQEANVDVSLMEFHMPKKWIPGETIFTISIGNTEEFTPAVVSKYMSPSGNYEMNIIYVKDEQEDTWSQKREEIRGNLVLVPSDLCLDISGLFAEYAFAKKIEDLAVEYGASGIIFMASRPKKLLYTFIGSKGIDNDMPQFVMAREDAKRCIRLIERGEKLSVKGRIKAKEGDSFISKNVIAEIKGSEFPEEIVLIGAHLDSWALGTGANDNGCNVSMMIDIARQMKKLDIKPKRTIRFALWNGEEQGYFGSWAYTQQNNGSLDDHKMTLSVDIGSGAIIGFFTNGREDIIKDINKYLKEVEGLGPFTHLNIPIVGTDNFDFMLEGVPNLVANHLSTSYGLNYHAASDTYDKVDLKSLKLNSVIVAALTLGWANDTNPSADWTRHSRDKIQEIFDSHNLEFTMRMFNVWNPWINGERGRKME